MLGIRLSFWHLKAFFMWLSFKFQFSAANTGHVILALKQLGKVKIHPRQVTKARRQGRYIGPLSLTSALDGMGGQLHTPAILPLGQASYRLYRRLCGSQVCSAWVWKILPPLGCNPQTVVCIASCYTNCAIPKY